ncbi:hypothetical protein AKJ09_06903 [Labilithrix luteola]|uniref:Uncharacterized protein n=1 Tax=Labilithrix luteola TaxID=1391654 RepID=A0A0K1Q4E0_9BACT|nr:hypothetical protein AKJ09_06903 [Labilithrix luteola]
MQGPPVPIGRHDDPRSSCRFAAAKKQVPRHSPGSGQGARQEES